MLTLINVICTLEKIHFKGGERTMPLPCHFTMEGEKQGKIEGSCEMEGREGSIIGYWLTHQVKVPHNPMDGFPTEKRSHYPLSIIKEHDKSSPKLHQALCTGEHMKYVIIEWYRINKYGREEYYFTHHLEDAAITGIRSFMPNTFLPETAHLPFMEKVSFSYRKIRWRYEPDGIETEDPYINEYGKNPLRDIGFALHACSVPVWTGIKTGVTDVAKAALFEFFELPWLLDKGYTITEIHDDVTHEFREKAVGVDHQINDLKRLWY
jgi:type VI secretion system secreted protein Hcp